jgi:sporulation protein YlmC with PRC-barrel domain
MHTRIFAAGLMALGLMVVPALFAQNDRDDKQSGHLYRASTLTDLSVKNGTGENAQNLGHIEDMVIDLNSGRVVYYALAHGQTLGFGGKMFAIAPGALKLSDKGEFFILNGVNNEQLDNAKGFSTDNWPTGPDTKFGKADAGPIEKGVKEVKEGLKGKPQMARLNSVIGMAVRTPRNESLGSVYDATVHVGDHHKIGYMVVSHGGTLGVGGKLYAVPLNKMRADSPRLKAGERVFVINTTQEQFQNLKGFTSNDNWPTQADQTFWGRVKDDDRNDRD